MRKEQQNALAKAGEAFAEGLSRLRSLEAKGWLWYLAGVGPFGLLLAGYWSEMTKGGRVGIFANAGYSCLLAVAYVWMKGCEYRFVCRLREVQPLPMARVLFAQVRIQPVFLLLGAASCCMPFLLPLAHGIAAIAVILGDSEERGLLRQSVAFAEKHSQALWTLAVYLAIPAILVFLNILAGLFALPYLAKCLLGISSVFVTAPLALLNSEFFLLGGAISYFVMEAVWLSVLERLEFVSATRDTGEDLLMKLRSRLPAAKQLLLGIVVASLLFAEMPALAAESEWDHTVEAVLQDPAYDWNLPTEKEYRNMDILEDFLRQIKEAVEELREWLRNLKEKLFGKEKDYSPAKADKGQGGVHSAMIMLGICLLLGLLAFWGYAWKKRRRQQLPETEASVAMPQPDLTDEKLSADALPLEGWARLAEELFAAGQFRPALRAWYLAHLASLAARRCIRLARGKGNRDYGRELARHTARGTTILQEFVASLHVFETVWYGNTEADAPLVTGMRERALRSATLSLQEALPPPLTGARQ